jgi:hypothetical protein
MVRKRTHLEVAIDVSSMPYTVHANDACMVVHGIKNPVIPLPEAVAILSNETFGSWRAWISREVINSSAYACAHLGWKAQEIASRSALDFNSVGALRSFSWASALTSSHAWNPVASFMASLRASASRRSSIFSRIASSTTELFWSLSRLQTASRVSARSIGSFVESVRISINGSPSGLRVSDSEWLDLGEL